jgi:hypothetical protein
MDPVVAASLALQAAEALGAAPERNRDGRSAQR